MLDTWAVGRWNRGGMPCNSRRRGPLTLLTGLMTLFFAGCGYSFQGTRSPMLEELGIQRIFVDTIRNDTLKPGVDTLVFNELVRVISLNKRVRVVQSAESADAILSGTVGSASYTRGALSSSAGLFPAPDKFPWVPRPSNTAVAATSYDAMLGISLIMTDPATEEQIWSNSFGRSKSFPANNQIGPFGTTAGLINESEFDRALRELVRAMMVDVHESMLAMF